jgi:hypothetical protein
MGEAPYFLFLCRSFLGEPAIGLELNTHRKRLLLAVWANNGNTLA